MPQTKTSTKTDSQNESTNPNIFKVSTPAKLEATQELQLNVIPFKHPNDKMTFGFVKEKRPGDFPVHRALLPKIIWGEHEAALKNLKYVYSNFTNSDGCDFVAEVDFNAGNNRFVKHYYAQLILRHFKEQVDVVNYNFVKDVEIWFRDISLSNDQYNAYQKFTIKVHFSRKTQSPAILISYDGKAYVCTKSIAELDVHTNYIKSVVYEKQLIGYKKLDPDAKNDMENCFPSLNRELSAELNIQLPKREIIKNRYPDYNKKIKHVLKKYLNTPSFKKIIPLNTKGFTKLNMLDWDQLSADSNQLRFHAGVHTDPKQGMKNFGPYKQCPHDNVRFFFIYQKTDEQYAVDLHELFLNGKDPYIKPLKNLIRHPFSIEKGASLAFESPATAMQELKNHLVNLDKAQHTKYVAIYISPIQKDEKLHHELYYQIKEELLKHEMTSQVIYKGHVHHNFFAEFMNTFAPSVLAKMGGIPWRLDRPACNDLIVGVGAFKPKGMNKTYLANSICFNNEGEFQSFDSVRNDKIDLLAGLISKQILKYFVDFGENAKRLIIHYYKPFSQKELDPIKATLDKLGLKIPVIVVTINKTESNDFVAFNSKSTAQMPLSGTYIQIFENQYLLFNNTHYDANEPAPEYCQFPIKLELFCSEEYYFEDSDNVDEVIDQVYQFSRMYWKSNRQQNMPVTIKYPEMVAKMLPHFESEHLPEFAKRVPWFL